MQLCLLLKNVNFYDSNSHCALSYIEEIVQVNQLHRYIYASSLGNYCSKNTYALIFSRSFTWDTALKYSHNLANTAEVPPQEVDLIEAVGGSILSDNKLPDTDLRVTRDITIEHYNMEKEVTAADSTGGDSSASATATSASGRCLDCP